MPFDTLGSGMTQFLYMKSFQKILLFYDFVSQKNKEHNIEMFREAHNLSTVCQEKITNTNPEP